jgi:hypothetical protein
VRTCPRIYLAVRTCPRIYLAVHTCPRIYLAVRSCPACLSRRDASWPASAAWCLWFRVSLNPKPEAWLASAPRGRHYACSSVCRVLARPSQAVTVGLRVPVTLSMTLPSAARRTTPPRVQASWPLLLIGRSATLLRRRRPRKPILLLLMHRLHGALTQQGALTEQGALTQQETLTQPSPAPFTLTSVSAHRCRGRGAGLGARRGDR